MEITQITIEIHEKRNHPYEYGHYDASCRLTADIEGTDDPDEVMGTLRMVARAEVLAELDEWIERIEHRRRQAQLNNAIRSHIYDLRYTSPGAERQEAAAEIETMIGQLDDVEAQEEWFRSLADKLEKLTQRDQQAEEDNEEEDGDNWPPESPF